MKKYLFGRYDNSKEWPKLRVINRKEYEEFMYNKEDGKGKHDVVLRLTDIYPKYYLLRRVGIHFYIAWFGSKESCYEEKIKKVKEGKNTNDFRVYEI